MVPTSPGSDAHIIQWLLWLALLVGGNIAVWWVVLHHVFDVV
jgi:hypothetical protein